MDEGLIDAKTPLSQGTTLRVSQPRLQRTVSVLSLLWAKPVPQRKLFSAVFISFLFSSSF